MDYIYISRANFTSRKVSNKNNTLKKLRLYNTLQAFFLWFWGPLTIYPVFNITMWYRKAKEIWFYDVIIILRSHSRLKKPCMCWTALSYRTLKVFIIKVVWKIEKKNGNAWNWTDKAGVLHKVGHFGHFVFNINIS